MYPPQGEMPMTTEPDTDNCTVHVLTSQSPVRQRPGELQAPSWPWDTLLGTFTSRDPFPVISLWASVGCPLVAIGLVCTPCFKLKSPWADPMTKDPLGGLQVSHFLFSDGEALSYGSRSQEPLSF